MNALHIRTQRFSAVRYLPTAVHDHTGHVTVLLRLNVQFAYLFEGVQVILSHTGTVSR